MRLVPGQKPEDFDEAARALAVARGVARCQVRELKPRRGVDRLPAPQPARRDRLVPRARRPGRRARRRRSTCGGCGAGAPTTAPTGTSRLPGSHTLHAGATGAGKGAQMWCPLVSIAPAIRDGLVRLSGIDPKGMELAYGRRIFHRYAVTGKDALALLDDLIEGADARKAEFAGRLRTVPITPREPVGDRRVRRDRRPDPLHRGPQAPRGHHRTGGAADHPGPGAGLHGARLRPGADEGHRAGAGAVPAPHLPARRDQVARRDGARRPGLRPGRVGEPDRRVRTRRRLPVRRRHPRTPARAGRLGARRHDQSNSKPSSPAAFPASRRSVHPFRTAQRAAPRGAA